MGIYPNLDTDGFQTIGKSKVEHLPKVRISNHEKPLLLQQENDQLLASVIVPVFNAEKTLVRCLKSLSKQKGGPYEVLIIDDGSTDRSGWIAQEFIRRESGDGEIEFHYIHQENKGVSSARNHGLRVAEGKYITFMDADDWAEAEWLIKMTEAAESNHADAVICGVLRHGQKRKVQLFGKTFFLPPQRQVSQYKKEEIPTKSAVFCDTFRADRDRCNVFNKLFRRSLFQGKVWFDPHTKIGEDLKFCVEVFALCQSYIRIPGILYHYDTRCGGAMANMKEKGFQREWLSEWNAVIYAARIYQGLPEIEKGSRREKINYLRSLRIKQLQVALKEIKLLADHLESQKVQEDTGRKEEKNTKTTYGKVEIDILCRRIRFVKKNKMYLIHFRRIREKRILDGLMAMHHLFANRGKADVFIKEYFS